ncbi:METRL protein, partial [Atractosteus spatula]|nr:METRL protein [Atractosteus spatula]
MRAGGEAGRRLGACLLLLQALSSAADLCTWRGSLMTIKLKVDLARSLGSVQTRRCSPGGSSRGRTGESCQDVQIPATPRQRTRALFCMTLHTCSGVRRNEKYTQLCADGLRAGWFGCIKGFQKHSRDTDSSLSPRRVASGLVREPHARVVQQVRLRCTEGAVEWVYPRQALRVVLQPNLASARPFTVCVKPFRGSRGASMHVERAGELELLLSEGARPARAHCFRADGPQPPAIFLQASPQSDIGRRAVGFQYELLGNRSSAPDLQDSVLQGVGVSSGDSGQSVVGVSSGVSGTPGSGGAGRPCRSSFLIPETVRPRHVTLARGFILNVSHDAERQTSRVEVGASRVYRQRGGVFVPGDAGGAWRGHVQTLLRCGARPGAGEFLFVGAEHFGEAWLGCAPRYRHFLSVYGAAQRRRENACEFPLD